jgi:hypothetical protein
VPIVLEAILEGVSTLGPIVLIMLVPILIPVFAIGISTIFDRVKAQGEST